MLGEASAQWATRYRRSMEVKSKEASKQATNVKELVCGGGMLWKRGCKNPVSMVSSFEEGMGARLKARCLALDTSSSLAPCSLRV